MTSSNPFERILTLAEINYVHARNPQRHVPNRNIIRYNVLFIYRKMMKTHINSKLIGIHKDNKLDIERNWDEELKTWGWSDTRFVASTKQLLSAILHIVTKIPVLSQYKIVKNLGAGSMGIALLLSNHRALKIGNPINPDNTSSETIEAFTYDQSYEIKSNMLPIFDQGRIEIPKKREEGSALYNNSGVLEWSEMPVLEVLERRSEEQKVISNIFLGLGKFIRRESNVSNPGTQDKDILIQLIEKFFSQEERFVSVDEDVVNIESLKRAYLSRAETDGHINDAHAGNVGKFPQTGEYVIFDN